MLSLRDWGLIGSGGAWLSVWGAWSLIRWMFS